MRPLGPVQYQWWHRLRNLPTAMFVAIGAVVVPGMIISVHAGTMLLMGGEVEQFGIVILAIVLMPFIGGAFYWTARYMERRYRATVPLRCGGCGYPRTGLLSERCPECGERLPGA